MTLAIGAGLGLLALTTACVGSDPGAGGTPDPGADGSTGSEASAVPDGGRGPTGDDGSADTGTDAGGDSSKGPFSPADLPGLALWLDADVATANVNGTVDSWHDKSSNANNGTTANDSQKPVLLTGASSINGHQALRFDGVANFFTIADNASLQWNQSFVIEVVFRHTQAAASQSGPVFSKQTATALNNPQGPSVQLAALLGSPHNAFVELQVGPQQFIDTDKTNGYSAGTPHRVRAAWDLPTTTVSLQIDKGTAYTKAFSGVTNLGAAGHDVLIGNGPDNFYMTADVAEIVALAGATIAPTDITSLQAYLDTKYGL